MKRYRNVGVLGNIPCDKVPSRIDVARSADDRVLSSPDPALDETSSMDNGSESDGLHQTIATALAELGKPELPCLSTRFLIRDGYCAGRRFLFEGIQAIWLIAENVVRLYDHDGRMLKSVAVVAANRTLARSG